MTPSFCSPPLAVGSCGDSSAWRWRRGSRSVTSGSHLPPREQLAAQRRRSATGFETDGACGRRCPIQRRTCFCRNRSIPHMRAASTTCRLSWRSADLSRTTARSEMSAGLGCGVACSGCWPGFCRGSQRILAWRFYSARIVRQCRLSLGYDRVEIFTFPVESASAASVHAADAALPRLGVGVFVWFAIATPERVVFRRGSQTSRISRRRTPRRRVLSEGATYLTAFYGSCRCLLCGGAPKGANWFAAHFICP